MPVYEKQFSPDLDIAAPAPVTRTLLIASTPRSGSHMLGHSLSETGAMGVPFEYCNPGNLKVWERRLGTRGVEKTLQEIMRLRTTPNGVFSIKLHYSHLSVLGGLEAALDFFPNPAVVLIYRADLLRQAISFSEAVQTGVWISDMEGTGDAASYDYKAIRNYLEMLALHNALWRLELEERGQDFTDVEFGALTRDLPGNIRRIADFAGIALPSDKLPEQPPTKVQSKRSKVVDLLRRYERDRARNDQRRSLPRRARGWIGGALK